MARPLYPPLTVIEENLFAPSDDLLDRWLQDDPDLSPEQRQEVEASPLARSLRDAKDDEPVISPGPPPAAIPPRLQAMFRQRDASRQARISPKPAPGQLLAVDQVTGPDGPLGWDLPRPLVVLLSEPVECDDVWYGWLVGTETDYATDWDLLLDASDQPLDPLAGMVQLWNPVHVYLPSTGRVLGELSPQRLAAVRALGLAFVIDDRSDAPPQPGEVLQRTLAGQTLRTGTPLAGDDDPRCRYQVVYHTAAEAVREPARLALGAEAARQNLTEVVKTWLQTAADWAARQGQTWAPAPALAMGTDSDDPTLPDFDLGQRLRLRFTVHDNHTCRLRTTLLDQTPLNLALLQDGRRLQKYRLTAEAPEAVFIFGLDQPHRLAIGDDGTALELPLPALPREH